MSLDYCQFFMSKYEKEKKIKSLKLNLGCGLAHSFYRYLENAIKGKNETPSHVEMLRRYKRDERLVEGHQWICPRLLILFPGKTNIF